MLIIALIYQKTPITATYGASWKCAELMRTNTSGPSTLSRVRARLYQTTPKTERPRQPPRRCLLLRANWQSLPADKSRIESTLECRRRLANIPGIGPIGATLLLMKTPAPEMFRSGRQFAAWIGLTPKDHSTAGKVSDGRCALGGMVSAAQPHPRRTYFAISMASR
jgi:Transposase IS116/IS110/IS902 family